MMTHRELAALSRSLRDEHVLTVYVDGSASDPAVQRSWMIELEHALADLRRQRDGAPRAEREELEQCVNLLRARVAELSPGLGSPGWVAFISAKRVHDAHALPVAVPTLAVWRPGPTVAPCVRALKEQRPVLIVLADARHARIYRYRKAELDRIDVVRAHHVLEHAEHMGAPSRVGYHVGTRGSSAHEAAQRSLLKGRDRMINEVVEQVATTSRPDGWVLVGGIRRVASRLIEALDDTLPHRVLSLDRERGSALDIHASDAEVTGFARLGASRLRDAADEERLNEMLEMAGAQGLAVIGEEATSVALGEASVRDLYLTHRYVADHPSEAEAAVRWALEQDAGIEEVSGCAAELLDDHGGVAAGLRFRVSLGERAVTASTDSAVDAHFGP